jgi:hypothetical protein
VRHYLHQAEVAPGPEFTEPRCFLCVTGLYFLFIDKFLAGYSLLTEAH